MMVDRQQRHHHQNMATTMDAGSFSSRRPAANGLPQFQLPAPTDIPSMQKPPYAVPSLPSSLSQPRSASTVLTPPPGVTDGLSPMLSNNTASSQSSGAATAIPSYYQQQQQQQQQQQHGNWPTPGSNSSYTYGSNNQSSQSLAQPGYGSRGGVYGQSPSLPYSSRSSQSPATGGEGLPPPPYDQQVHHSFPAPLSGGGGSGGGAANTGPTQPSLATQGQQPQNSMLSSQSPAQTQAQHAPPVSAPAHLDAYSQSRPPPTQSYYTPSSTPQQPNFPSYAAPQQSPNHPSPTTTGAGQRPVSAMAQPTGMAPPQPYRPPYQHQYQGMPHQMSGPIMSNVGNPGGQMALVPGMGVHHTYGPMPHSLYGHGTPQPQQERPFKCDQCTQSFNRNHDLKRHRRIHLAVKPFPCTFCEKSFSRKDALKRHRLVKGCDTEAAKNANREGKDASAGAQSDRGVNASVDSIKKE